MKGVLQPNFDRYEASCFVKLFITEGRNGAFYSRWCLGASLFWARGRSPSNKNEGLNISGNETTHFSQGANITFHPKGFKQDFVVIINVLHFDQEIKSRDSKRQVPLVNS